MPDAVGTYARSRRRTHQYQTRVIPGQIMWLPSKDQVKIETGIENECHNHPVVILSPEPVKGEVVVLLIISFNGVDLKVKHRHSKQARLAHLPIEPCPRHPDNGILLSLQDKRVLGKRSYIKIERKYRILFSVLRCYYDRSQERCILTEASYKKLIQHAKFNPVTSREIRVYLHPEFTPITPSEHPGQSGSSADTSRGTITTELISRTTVTAQSKYWAAGAIKWAKAGMESVWSLIKVIQGMLGKVWNWM